MTRREFIMLFGGAAAAVWPLAARAQRAGKLPTIGFLGPSSPAAVGPWVAAFVQRLGELGWVEGRNVVIEYGWAEGHADRISEIAAAFADRKVDVIVTHGNVAVGAIKRATSEIPIVFASANDPVGGGLVNSLARPGGNGTGLSLQQTGTGSKRLALLHEIAPSLRRLAIMANAGNSGSVLEMRDVETAGRTLGLEVAPVEIRRAEDIVPAFGVIEGRADALYVSGDALLNALLLRPQSDINAFVARTKLPTMFNQSAMVKAGGLMSYGPSFPALFRRAAELVDKILHGAKPADIPVEQPTKFELVINLKTAKALSLAVPQSLLVAADEVIE
ncbi:MAG TPA: ABC transporter substrate-binding protein [Pseudolabrys sp.]|nr:ABC transporter substrate-binding protein [Pseudolabrys sp.]